MARERGDDTRRADVGVWKRRVAILLAALESAVGPETCRLPSDGRPLRILLGVATLLVLGTAPILALFLASRAARPPERGGRAWPVPAEHVIEVTARRYSFVPSVIRVARGDTVRLRFASQDVVHGFSLEGYDLDVAIEPLRREVRVRRGDGAHETLREVELVAAKTGKFRFRCSKTCGAMHPFMVGELIVEPNWTYRIPGFAGAGLLLGVLGWAWLRSSAGEAVP